jgi:hypothetical protein
MITPPQLSAFTKNEGIMNEINKKESFRLSAGTSTG